MNTILFKPTDTAVSYQRRHPSAVNGHNCQLSTGVTSAKNWHKCQLSLAVVVIIHDLPLRNLVGAKCTFAELCPYGFADTSLRKPALSGHVTLAAAKTRGSFAALCSDKCCSCNARMSQSLSVTVNGATSRKGDAGFLTENTARPPVTTCRSRKE